MKFGPLPVPEAEGAVLAHRLRVGDKTFKKGRVLSPSDLSSLADAGFTEVTAARLEDGDLDENQAAALIAESAAGEHVSTSAPGTGRCNLYAETRGLVIIDRARVDRVNRVDEAIGISTLQPYDMVEAGQMVATVKLVTFAVAGETARAAAGAAATDGPLLRVAPFQRHKVGLIQTVLPGGKKSIYEKTAATTRARLGVLDNRLHGEVLCAHREDNIAAVLEELEAEGCDLVLVLGASAIVDRRDVVPSAVVRAGGEILHFGMPVDPGNLMLLARHGKCWILGLPGSARSPRQHGFDWLLQRLLAGVALEGSDIMGMGVGGLLKEIPARPLPRATAAPAPAPIRAASATRRIAALVLAAGQSRRMGKVNKLLAEIDGALMVARVVDAVLASRASPVVVVTGHDEDRVRAALAERDVRFVHNPDYAGGLSTSLRHGVAALPDDIDGTLVCLGDMPRVAAAHLDRLIDAFAPAEGQLVCVPTHHGKRGNPVLWSRRFFGELQDLAGDVGARHLIGEHADLVREVEMEDDGVLADVDSPAALTRLKGKKSA